MNVVTVARRVVAAALVLLAVGALGVSVAARTDRVRFSRVLTGSMDPAVPSGALVMARPLDTDRIERGQVIVFMPPAPFGTPDGRPIAHRVVDVTTEGGQVLVRTKGDANAAEDPWTLNASRSTVFRLGWASPFAGRAVEVAGRGGLSVALATVTAVLALRALLAIWRPAPRRGRRRQAAGIVWLRDAAA